MSCKVLATCLLLFTAMVCHAGDDSSMPLNKLSSETSQELLNWIRSEEVPDDFAKLRKQAEKLSSLFPNANPDANQNTMRLLLTRARYRQEHHLLGSQDLAQNVLKCLQQEAETDTASKAIAYAILIAQAQELSGLPSKATQTLEDCLQAYFPDALKHSAWARRALPLAAKVILIQLGDLYLSQAQTALDMKNKEQGYSMAAGCLIRIASSESGKDSGGKPIEKDLLQKISTCQDALALLGRKLNVPTFLKDQLGESHVGLVGQLVRNHKYHAALKLIGRSDPSKSLELFRLTCLLELGRVDKSLECAKKLAEEYGELLDVQEAIFLAASHWESVKHIKQASEFYLLFANTAKDHFQAPEALLKRATYCRLEKQLAQAAKLFERIAQEYPQRTELTAKCYFSAAQCYQQSHDFMHAKDCAVKAEDKANEDLRSIAGFLAAHSALRYALQKSTLHDAKQQQATWAQVHFAKILVDKSLSIALRRQATQGAQLAAQTAGNVVDAVYYFEAYLKCKGVKPDESDSVAAQRLIGMAASQKDAKSILNLTAIAIRQSIPDAIYLSVGGMGELIKLNAQADALVICEQLQSQTSIPDAHLLSIVMMLDSKDFESYRELADKMQLALAVPRLDTVSKATCELLLYQLSVTAFRQSVYNEALILLNRHLGKEYAYKYLESKLLRASVLVKLQRGDEARTDYKEVLLASQDQGMTIRTSAALAQTYMHTQQWQEALSAACFCLPLLQHQDLPKDQLESLRQCLEIVCDAYYQLDQHDFFRKYVGQYLQVFAEGPKVEQYRHALYQLSMNKKSEMP